MGIGKGGINMKWMIIEIDGTNSKEGELTLEEKQKVVGGYIEIVKTQCGIMIVNEEGLLYGLPVNETASMLARRVIVGRVLMEELEEVE